MLTKWYFLLLISTLQFLQFNFVDSCEDNILEFGENYDKGTPPQGIQKPFLENLVADDMLSFSICSQI